MVKLRIKNLTKIYNKKTVLNNITFSVEDGEFLSILGSSGCGKTTLLRIIIGIETPTSGKITKDRKNITKLDASKRGMGIVFQDYALFPNMTVLENVMYALKLKLKDKKKAKEESLKMIEMVNMQEHINKYPHELSGGQKQRVAIASILLKDSKFIFFDEPTSGMDYVNMIKISELIRQNRKDSNIIFIVSHDIEFLNATADSVVHIY